MFTSVSGASDPRAAPGRALTGWRLSPPALPRLPEVMWFVVADLHDLQIIEIVRHVGPLVILPIGFDPRLALVVASLKLGKIRIWQTASRSVNYSKHRGPFSCRSLRRHPPL